MRQFQCVPTTYVFSINEFLTISFFLNKFSTTFIYSKKWACRNEQVFMSCKWRTIIGCQFYASDSLSWDVSWEYIAKLLVACCKSFQHITVTSIANTDYGTKKTKDMENGIFCFFYFLYIFNNYMVFKNEFALKNYYLSLYKKKDANFFIL